MKANARSEKTSFDLKIVEACKEAVTQSVLASKKRRGSTSRHDKAHDNPDVGAVFLDGNGDIISAAYRHEIGNFHAEVSAIAKMFRDNMDLLEKIHTVVTTLEPCSVRPKNNMFPCVKFLIYFGVKMVYIASFDTAIMVRGRGANLLDTHNIMISTFPHEQSRKAIREVINKEYDEYRKKEAEELYTYVNSKDEAKFYKALSKLFDNAIRDVVSPSVSDLPKEILDDLNAETDFIDIAKDARKELKAYRKNKNEFVTLFRVKYGERLEKVLDKELDIAILSPIKLKRREALAIHLLISRDDPKLEDKIYFEIASYILTKRFR